MLTTENLQEFWARNLIPAVQQQSLSIATLFSLAHVTVVDGWLVICAFPGPDHELIANQRHNRQLVQTILQRLADDDDLRLGIRHLAG